MNIIEVPIERLNGIDLNSVPGVLCNLQGVSEVTILEITGQLVVYCVDETITMESLLETLQQIDGVTSNKNSPQRKQGEMIADRKKS